MKPEEFFKKIFSFRLWMNLFAMIVVIVLLCFGLKMGIDVYTHHGEEITIPDIKHKNFADAEHILANVGLRITVSDTGYVKTLPPDCILEQTPMAGKNVKSGRVIYVVINSSATPMLTIPDVIDNCSYREAKAKLSAMGFKIGTIEYLPGEKDWVYGLKSKGRNLQNGQKVSVDNIIVIQIGDGMRDMNESVEFADPSTYYDEYGDSLSARSRHEYGGVNDVDEFEIVSSPE
ncbi:MAG: PASTA domain-containing protein [Prevotella sp.]